MQDLEYDAFLLGMHRILNLADPTLRIIALKGQFHEKVYGLWVWTPNINIFTNLGYTVPVHMYIWFLRDSVTRFSTLVFFIKQSPLGP
jgi:hypothetical protein